MPGVPGAKEVYGISIIREDLSLKIPPAACERYKVTNETAVVLTTTHRGESGFALLNKCRGETTVFKKYIDRLGEFNTVYWFSDKAYVMVPFENGKINITSDMMSAFHLNIGDKLLVIKGAAVAMSFTPIDIWKDKFLKRGLQEAIDNMDKLEAF